MNAYLFLKLIHVVAVIIFMGNIITGLFWMRQANKTNNFSIISFTMKGVIASDRWFTIPGVVVITPRGLRCYTGRGSTIKNRVDILVDCVVYLIRTYILVESCSPAKKILR